MPEKNENRWSLRKSVVTSEIAAAQMWKPGGSVGHGAEKFCNPLPSPGTNRQYLLQVSICQEECYIPCKIAGFTPILVLKGGRYHGVWEGLNRVSQTLNNVIEVAPPENPGECKARLFWFGLSTVYLTSLQQKAPLTTETLKSHVRKSLPAPLVSPIDLSSVHKLASKNLSSLPAQRKV